MPAPCLFCQIVARERPAAIVYQDEQVTAFRDINPKAPTHLLVVPNRHIATIAEAEPGDEAMLGKLLLAAAQVAKQEGLESYRLVVNNGSGAGQSVWHLHVHILGGRPMHWPPG